MTERRIIDVLLNFDESQNLLFLVILSINVTNLPLHNNVSPAMGVIWTKRKNPKISQTFSA